MRLHKNEADGTHVTELEARGSDTVIREGLRGGPLSESVEPGRAVADVVAERTKAGWVPEISPEPHAARFFREGFEQLLVDSYGVARGEPSERVIEEIETTYGHDVPQIGRAHV